MCQPHPVWLPGQHATTLTGWNIICLHNKAKGGVPLVMMQILMQQPQQVPLLLSHCL